MSGSLRQSSDKHKETYSKFNEIIKYAYNYKDAMEKQGLKQEDVDLLYEKTSKSKLVPRFIHDKQLLLFVNASKTDMDRAARWIHKYYRVKQNAPEFFTKRDVHSEEIQEALKNQIYLTLPVTPNNYNVMLHRLKNFDPKTYKFDLTIKTFGMAAEACMFRSGPTDGAILIYDLKGGGFRHLFQPSISSIRKGIEFLQSANPVTVVAIHVFNCTLLMDFIFSMIKPFLKSDFYARIHLHKSGTCDDEFFEKWVPRSHMPSEYGGTLGTIDELHEQNRQHLYEMHEYFVIEEQQMKLELEDLDRYLCQNDDDDDDDFYDADD